MFCYPEKAKPCSIVSGIIPWKWGKGVTVCSLNSLAHYKPARVKGHDIVQVYCFGHFIRWESKNLRNKSEIDRLAERLKDKNGTHIHSVHIVQEQTMLTQPKI